MLHPDDIDLQFYRTWQSIRVDVHPCLIFGMDEFACYLDMTNNRRRTYVRRSSKTVKLKEDKRCFTCAVTRDLTQIVELQMIWAGKTDRVHANVSTPDARIRQDHSETHFQTGETCLAWAVRLHEHASVLC
jgi:hypothetical protein